MEIMLRSLVILVVGLTAQSGWAQVVVPDLPLREFATIGEGTSPAIGHKSGTRSSVHYLAENAASGKLEPTFWSSYSRTSEATWLPTYLATLPFVPPSIDPIECDWHSSQVFCVLTTHFAPTYRGNDKVMVYDHSAPGFAEVEFTVPTPQFPETAPVRLGGVLNGRVAIELPETSSPIDQSTTRNSEIRLIQYNGTSNLSNMAVAGANSAEVVSHALLNSNDQVVYQSYAGGDYSVNQFSISSNAVVQSTPPSSTPLNPSDTEGVGFAVDIGNTVGIVGFDNGWFPSVDIPDPLVFGCSKFRNLKLDWKPGPDIWLVQGLACNGEPSVLFALIKRTAASAWEAYRVGAVSETDPQFEIVGDEFVFVDQTGAVQWVRHALEPLVYFDYVLEIEPNDLSANAAPVPLAADDQYAVIGRGTLDGVSDIDFWRVDAAAGTSVSVSTYPEYSCTSGATSYSMLSAYDEDGLLIGTSSPSGTEICPVLDFIVPSTGTYHVKLENLSSLSFEYELKFYSLTNP